METLRPQSTLVCDESGAVLIEVLPVPCSRVASGYSLTVSARLRPAIPRGAEGLLRSFQTRDVAVLRSIAALPLVKFEAPESRGFARRVGNGLVDAADMPPFKQDVVAFSVAGVGIALQDQRFFGHLVNLPRYARTKSSQPPPTKRECDQQGRGARSNDQTLRQCRCRAKLRNLFLLKLQSP